MCQFLRDADPVAECRRSLYDRASTSMSRRMAGHTTSTGRAVGYPHHQIPVLFHTASLPWPVSCAVEYPLPNDEVSEVGCWRQHEGLLTVYDTS